jgi:hypothetical protein
MPRPSVRSAILESSKINTGSLTSRQHRDFEARRFFLLFNEALTLQVSGNLEQALQHCQQMTKLHGFYQPSILDRMTKLCNQTDTSGQRAMEMIKSWPRDQRYYWLRSQLDHRVMDRFRDEFARITRPAIRAAQVPLLIGWLYEVERNLSPKHARFLFNIRNAVAYIHSEIMHDIPKAKQFRMKMLQMRPNQEGGNAHEFNTWLSVEWMRHANMIFSQFQAAPRLHAKLQLLEELQAISRLHKSDELKESHVGVLVAHMLRVLGPAREYQRYMEDLFCMCLEMLQDGVLYNDGPSLRLLAKIVGSLEGLEHDACIAYSAQFSILDRAIHNSRDDAKHQSTNDKILQTLSPLADEESSDESYLCDGCGRVQTQWLASQYMCLICPNLDLCDTCFGKEKESYRQIVVEDILHSDEQWIRMCSKAYQHINGPMKGWKGIKEGIKEGIIRIDDELSVADWLQQLKETRWPTAWDNLWLTQGFLKDISDGKLWDLGLPERGMSSSLEAA